MKPGREEVIDDLHLALAISGMGCRDRVNEIGSIQVASNDVAGVNGNVKQLKKLDSVLKCEAGCGNSDWHGTLGYYS